MNFNMGENWLLEETKALSEGMRQKNSVSKVENSLGWKKTVMLRSKLNITHFNLFLAAQAKSKTQQI